MMEQHGKIMNGGGNGCECRDGGEQLLSTVPRPDGEPRS